jgi:hypothetical protein
MAFDNSQLSLMAQCNGYKLYRYDTLDAHATVDSAGYFNNSDDTINLAVGDIIEVVVWATAIRTGTISTYGKHIVLSVSAAGLVDTSNVTVGVVTDSD